jgi:nucleoside-diphosphate-sugar epimerase
MNEIGIIGASGFIGKNLCMHFHKEKIDFVAIHRTKPKTDLPYNVLIKKSFTDLPEFKKLIFLAGPAHLSKDLEDMHYIENAKKTLTDALSASEAQFIYASSAAVYGDKDIKKHSVNSKLNPTSIYAEAKIASEKIVLENNGVVLRLANIFGHGMSENNVLSKLIRQFRVENTQLEVWDKTPIRDFLFIEDLVIFFEQLIKKELPSQILNVGSGSSHSIGDVYEALVNVGLANKVFKKEGIPLLETEPNKKVSAIKLDIEKTKNAVDWAPSFSLYRGLNKMIYQKKL